ncbi:MAG: hypothetical protein ACLR8Y_06435 [Alistipes indistinctus]
MPHSSNDASGSTPSGKKRVKSVLSRVGPGKTERVSKSKYFFGRQLRAGLFAVGFHEQRRECAPADFKRRPVGCAVALQGREDPLSG